ncbi:hypothetical protein H0X06_06765, partial [Candidatus Dependentiae bacterium]|nr:hypothetical protein [Candidatus Dependentiae bacterium]
MDSMALFQVIISEIALIKESVKNTYKTPYGCLYTPFDEVSVKACMKAALRLKSLNPTIFLLIGIGGSNM